MDWLQNFNPDAAGCWICGFSFGAWIAMQLLMRRPEIDGFIAVSPPTNMFDFTFLAPCPSPGLIIHGGDDELVPEPGVADFASRLVGKRQIDIDYRSIEGANHFFHGHIDVFTGQVEDYLSSRLGAAPGASSPSSS